MIFENAVEIAVPRATAWEFLWDVDRFIVCVPGCDEAQTVEQGKHYSAKMVAKVGAVVLPLARKAGRAARVVVVAPRPVNTSTPCCVPLPETFAT